MPVKERWETPWRKLGQRVVPKHTRAGDKSVKAAKLILHSSKFIAFIKRTSSQPTEQPEQTAHKNAHGPLGPAKRPLFLAVRRLPRHLALFFASLGALLPKSACPFTTFCGRLLWKAKLYEILLKEIFLCQVFLFLLTSAVTAST